MTTSQTIGGVDSSKVDSSDNRVVVTFKSRAMAEKVRPVLQPVPSFSADSFLLSHTGTRTRNQHHRPVNPDIDIVVQRSSFGDACEQRQRACRACSSSGRRGQERRQGLGRRGGRGPEKEMKLVQIIFNRVQELKNVVGSRSLPT